MIFLWYQNIMFNIPRDVWPDILREPAIAAAFSATCRDARVLAAGTFTRSESTAVGGGLRRIIVVGRHYDNCITFGASTMWAGYELALDEYYAIYDGKMYLTDHFFRLRTLDTTLCAVVDISGEYMMVQWCDIDTISAFPLDLRAVYSFAIVDAPVLAEFSGCLASVDKSHSIAPEIITDVTKITDFALVLTRLDTIV